MNRLDEIEARARKGALMHDIGPTSDREWALCATAIREDVPALVAALRAVLELHKREESPSGDYCDECFLKEWHWPCSTVETIRRHLGDDL